MYTVPGQLHVEPYPLCRLAFVTQPENKAIARLKRYIVLCGVRRNYKKLFSNSKSLKSKIDVLKKELEDIGIKGKSQHLRFCLY